MGTETWYRKWRIGPLIFTIGKGGRRVWFVSWGLVILGRYAFGVRRPLPWEGASNE